MWPQGALHYRVFGNGLGQGFHLGLEVVFGVGVAARRLRDLGNTVLVVEHDEDAIRTADYIVDMGPGAGIHGGRVMAQGTYEEVAANPASLTGRYLARTLRIAVPARRAWHGASAEASALRIVNARGNNLDRKSVV